MESNSRKYKDLISAGHHLFWKYGFRRVTIEEICRKADASKMTFYKYFPDKTELAKRVFDNVVEEGIQQVRNIMKDDSPAPEKIRRLLLMKMEGTNDISPEFLQDFYMCSGELKSYLEDKTKKAWDSIINDFRDAQASGTFRKDFKPEVIIKIQSKIVELLGDSSLHAMYDSRQELLMEFAKFMFYGIAPNE